MAAQAWMHQSAAAAGGSGRGSMLYLFEVDVLSLQQPTLCMRS
jgi:hypothetical protein